MFHAVTKNVLVQFVLEKSIIGINKFDDFKNYMTVGASLGKFTEVEFSSMKSSVQYSSIKSSSVL